MNIRTLTALSIAALSLLLAAESRAGEPCCNIVAVQPSGAVTARDGKTGRTFDFRVADRRLLSTLKAGQPVHADFTAMRVSVEPDGSEPCCSIVSAAPAATAPVSSASPCCGVVANAALRRLGRIVVAYPEEVATRIDVFRAGETKALTTGYGDQGFDLLPGTYDVSISGKRVAGVTVRAGYDTQIKVGLLRVSASEGTRIDLADPASKERIVSGYGPQLFGLPVGEIGVEIAGQIENVVIETGQVAEF